jgi:hypothetical protein
MDITFHLVPQRYFDSLDPGSDYSPEGFADEGFIHSTDDPEEMARVANRLYRSEPPPHVYLYIDKERVCADSVRRCGTHVPAHIWAAESRCDCGDSSGAARC